MKQILCFFLISLLLFSCSGKTQISKDFDCSRDFFSSTEKITDMKKLFSVEFPKKWKTNLYFDSGQSSIYGADTTKQLTKSVLLDVSFIQQSVFFDDNFKLNLEREKLSESLIRIKSKNQNFNKRESYYALSIGKKGNYKYQVLDYFIKVNNQSFLHAKTQVYGDSLVNERLCEAIQLIEKIKFQ